MKKILILIDSLSNGGAEKVLYTFLKHWNKTDYQFTVSPIVDTGVYASQIKKIKGIQYQPILSNTANNLIQRIKYALTYKLIYSILPVKWVYKWFIPKNHDIEIAFCEGFVTKLLSESTNKKAYKIAWVHTDLVLNNWPLQSQIYKSDLDTTHIYQSFHKVVGVSKATCQGLSGTYHIKNTKLIYNPLNKQEILQQAYHPVKEKDKRFFYIIAVGRLTHVKGFDRLLVCVERLNKKSLPVKLSIVGDGADKAKLKQLIKELHIEDNVELLGFQDNPYKYIANADLFVCSSRHEGFSLVIAEAMILGIPIVSTDCAGPAELTANGKYGLLVENSVEGLTEGIEKMIINPNLREEYKLLSTERSSLFNLNYVIQQTEELFNYGN